MGRVRYRQDSRIRIRYAGREGTTEQGVITGHQVRKIKCLMMGMKPAGMGVEGDCFVEGSMKT